MINNTGSATKTKLIHVTRLAASFITDNSFLTGLLKILKFCLGSAVFQIISPDLDTDKEPAPFHQTRRGGANTQ